MIELLITLIFYGLLLAILWWAVSQIPVPAPFSWVIRVVFALIVCLVLISLLTGSIPPLGGRHLVL
jgi:hypothetical protein